MSCKQKRFFGAESTNTKGLPVYGTSGIKVVRNAAGQQISPAVIYWATGQITDIAYNTVAPVSDIANYAAAQLAETADCSSVSTLYFQGEDATGKDVIVTVTNGLVASAAYLDGSAYTGLLGDLNWNDADDKELASFPVCFNGNNLIALVQTSDNAQSGLTDTQLLTANLAATVFITPMGVVATTVPTQADFNTGVASVGECRVSTPPPTYSLCGNC